MSQVHEELVSMLSKLLNTLVCPICHHFISRPIFQCAKGHVICSSCRKKFKECSVCKNVFSDIRNISLEQISGFMLFPCCKSNCTEWLPIAELHAHELLCQPSESTQKYNPSTACGILNAVKEKRKRLKHPSVGSLSVDVSTVGPVMAWVNYYRNQDMKDAAEAILDQARFKERIDDPGFQICPKKNPRNEVIEKSSTVSNASSMQEELKNLIPDVSVPPPLYNVQNYKPPIPQYISESPDLKKLVEIQINKKSASKLEADTQDSGCSKPLGDVSGVNTALTNAIPLSTLPHNSLESGYNKTVNNIPCEITVNLSSNTVLAASKPRQAFVYGSPRYPPNFSQQSVIIHADKAGPSLQPVPLLFPEQKQNFQSNQVLNVHPISLQSQKSAEISNVGLKLKSLRQVVPIPRVSVPESGPLAKPNTFSVLPSQSLIQSYMSDSSTKTCSQQQIQPEDKSQMELSRNETVSEANNMDKTAESVLNSKKAENRQISSLNADGPLEQQNSKGHKSLGKEESLDNLLIQEPEKNLISHSELSIKNHCSGTDYMELSTPPSHPDKKKSVLINPFPSGEQQSTNPILAEAALSALCGGDPPPGFPGPFNQTIQLDYRPVNYPRADIITASPGLSNLTQLYGSHVPNHQSFIANTLASSNQLTAAPFYPPEFLYYTYPPNSFQQYPPFY